MLIVYKQNIDDQIVPLHYVYLYSVDFEVWSKNITSYTYITYTCTLIFHNNKKRSFCIRVRDKFAGVERVSEKRN